MGPHQLTVIDYQRDGSRRRCGRDLGSGADSFLAGTSAELQALPGGPSWGPAQPVTALPRGRLSPGVFPPRHDDVPRIDATKRDARAGSPSTPTPASFSAPAPVQAAGSSRQRPLPLGPPDCYPVRITAAVGRHPPLVPRGSASPGLTAGCLLHHPLTEPQSLAGRVAVLPRFIRPRRGGRPRCPTPARRDLGIVRTLSLHADVSPTLTLSRHPSCKTPQVRPARRPPRTRPPPHPQPRPASSHRGSRPGWPGRATLIRGRLGGRLHGIAVPRRLDARSMGTVGVGVAWSPCAFPRPDR
jgi:hypothetical protein